MTEIDFLWVGIGGFFGAIARYSISKKLNGKTSFSLPLGTLVVNLRGAFLLGIISGAGTDPLVSLLLGTGFMGAFTTFSTLKLEMVQLLVKDCRKALLLYSVITYGCGIALAWLGFLLGKGLF